MAVLRYEEITITRMTTSLSRESQKYTDGQTGKVSYITNELVINKRMRVSLKSRNLLHTSILNYLSVCLFVYLSINLPTCIF